jgi:NTP pyrophosphatase (non-canonical NTP hydrolase)
MQPVRREVEEFAEAMELELMKHDDRPGWKECDTAWLLKRLREETNELETTLKDKNLNGKITRIKEEAADVGNFAMMISDVTKEDWVRRSAQKIRLGDDF